MSEPVPGAIWGTLFGVVGVLLIPSPIVLAVLAVRASARRDKVIYVVSSLFAGFLAFFGVGVPIFRLSDLPENLDSLPGLLGMAAGYGVFCAVQVIRLSRRTGVLEQARERFRARLEVGRE